MFGKIKESESKSVHFTPILVQTFYPIKNYRGNFLVSYRYYLQQEDLFILTKISISEQESFLPPQKREDVGELSTDG